MVTRSFSCLSLCDNIQPKIQIKGGMHNLPRCWSKWVMCPPPTWSGMNCSPKKN